MSFRSFSLWKSVSITACVVTLVILFLAGVSGVYAMPSEAGAGYNYAQLNAQERKFYDALLDMYPGGAINSAKSYDLVANSVVTAADIKNSLAGDANMKGCFAAAKNAFARDFGLVAGSLDNIKLIFSMQGDVYSAFIKTELDYNQ